MSDKHWQKKKIKGMTKGGFYNIDQLVTDYGLQIKTVWYEAFDNAGQTRSKLFTKNEKEW